MTAPISKEFIKPDDLNISKLEITGSTSTPIEDVPFDFRSKDFLNFAVEDLKGKSLRNTVNALSNIKRSIDCLSDSLLFVMNFLQKSKRERWSFPEKMDFLAEIGIITPYILQKINSMRNLLEHEFKKPNREEVESAFDVANLFYYATHKFTKAFAEEIVVSDPKNEEVCIKVDRKGKKIEVLSKDESGQYISFIVDENHKEYKNWLRVYFQIQYECV